MTCKLIESSNAAAKAVAPGARLSQTAEAALRAAHAAESHVGAIYAAIVAQFGQVAPFDNLQMAERRHAAAPATMMKAYGHAVPHLHGHPHHHSGGHSHEHAHGGRGLHRCGQTHVKGH